jgi:hypothetical protein
MKAPGSVQVEKREGRLEEERKKIRTLQSGAAERSELQYSFSEPQLCYFI